MGAARATLTASLKGHRVPEAPDPLSFRVCNHPGDTPHARMALHRPHRRRVPGLDAVAHTQPPKPGEVLVEIKAASLNFPDLLMVQNKYQIKPPLPFVPGAE